MDIELNFESDFDREAAALRQEMERLLARYPSLNPSYAADLKLERLQQHLEAAIAGIAQALRPLIELAQAFVEAVVDVWHELAAAVWESMAEVEGLPDNIRLECRRLALAYRLPRWMPWAARQWVAWHMPRPLLRSP